MNRIWTLKYAWNQHKAIFRSLGIRHCSQRHRSINPYRPAKRGCWPDDGSDLNVGPPNRFVGGYRAQTLACDGNKHKSTYKVLLSLRRLTSILAVSISTKPSNWCCWSCIEFECWNKDEIKIDRCFKSLKASFFCHPDIYQTLTHLLGLLLVHWVRILEFSGNQDKAIFQILLRHLWHCSRRPWYLSTLSTSRSAQRICWRWLEFGRRNKRESA